MSLTSINKYAYYLKDATNIGVVKWDISENRWVTPDKVETDGLYFTYTKMIDPSAAGVANTDTLTDYGIPASLNKALIFYAKAFLAEELNDLERREYFMRLFRRAVGRAQNNNIGSFRRMSSGLHAIR